MKQYIRLYTNNDVLLAESPPVTSQGPPALSAPTRYYALTSGNEVGRPVPVRKPSSSTELVPTNSSGHRGKYPYRRKQTVEVSEVTFL